MDTNQDYRDHVDKAWRSDIQRRANWPVNGLSRERLLSIAHDLSVDFDELKRETNGFREGSDEQREQAKQLLGKHQLLEDLIADPTLGGALTLQPHPGHATKGRKEAEKAARIGGHGRRDDSTFGRLPGIGRAWIEGMTDSGVTLKAAVDSTSGGTMTPAFFDPQIRDLPQRQLFLRSLIRTVSVSTDKFDYMRQTVATNNAAPVAAGALKPTSVYSTERIEDTVRTIAHVSEAMDRMLLDDVDQLVDWLDNQLRLGVLLAEEDQLLNGTGVAPQLRGILNTSGIQTQARGADSNPDAIHKAITKVRNSFFEPDGIVINPSNWESIRLLKAADGTYIAAPVLEADPNRLWGLEVITSPMIAAGTALVGAFGTAATVYDREQARVTFTESGLGDSAGQELFTRNQIRWRAESRIGLAVERPAAFATVTGLA